VLQAHRKAKSIFQFPTANKQKKKKKKKKNCQPPTFQISNFGSCCAPASRHVSLFGGKNAHDLAKEKKKKNEGMRSLFSFVFFSFVRDVVWRAAAKAERSEAN